MFVSKCDQEANCVFNALLQGNVCVVFVFLAAQQEKLLYTYICDDSYVKSPASRQVKHDKSAASNMGAARH